MATDLTPGFAQRYHYGAILHPPKFVFFTDPLIKATKTKPMKLNLGTAGGLPIIAIGKLGGKIVGYTAAHKPIYAGSSQAKKLASHAKVTVSFATLLGWLKELGINAKIDDSHGYGTAFIAVPAAAGTAMEEQFNISGTPIGHAKIFTVNALAKHVGKPFSPKEDEHLTYAAKMAAGDEEGIFPDLGALKEIPAGKYAGSHGNKLYVDPKGKKWVFKQADPTIARAEEAASRIGRLIMGDTIPPVQVVKLHGKDGALIGEVAGNPLNETNHSNPPDVALKKYASTIAMHQVVDWLTSNHDGHAGNFLDTGKGLNAIDKGQAWKFFGKDELSPTYSPNPSKPIYVKFWKMVASGAVPQADVREGIKAALEKAKAISPEQFKSIVAPYVSTAGAHMGFDTNKRMKAMLERLQNLEEDFSKLFKDVTGLELKEPGEDNFETMPVVTEQVSGWPMTKKKVTIHHPGGPKPSGWPVNYPGPGFKAEIVYKKQTYRVNFLDVGGKISVVMEYPDVYVKTFDSPAKASDSMKLWSDNLPLDMGATEKKKKGIAYPASTAFGLKAFKDELAAASGVQLPESAKTVQELDKDKAIDPKATELDIIAMLQKEPDGPISEPSLLPNELKDFLAANQQKIPHDWPAEIAPGIPVKLTGSADQPFFAASKIDAEGKPEYQMWVQNLDESGWMTPGPMGYHTIDDTIHEQVSMVPAAGLVAWKNSQKLPKDQDPIGPSPVPEFSDKVKVIIPKHAPVHTTAPLPDGASLKIPKKFPWGTEEVSLAKGVGNIWVVVFSNAAKDMVLKQFKSLSAAADFVWLAQKGYLDAADYKKQTGKKKVPSGGGWKFWGIDPKAPSKSIKPPPEAIAPSAPGMAYWEGLGPGGSEYLSEFAPSIDKLKAAPIGTTYELNHPTDGSMTLTRTAEGWYVDATTPFADSYEVQIEIGEVLDAEGTVKVTAPVVGWQWSDQPPSGYKIKAIPIDLEAEPIGVKPPKPELTEPVIAVSETKLEEDAAKAKAKEIQEWAATTQPVTDPKALHVLAHFQNWADDDYFVKNGTLWARQEGDHLLIGCESDFALPDMMKKEFPKASTVDTPLGTFWKVKISDIQKALPGQPADQVKGPDGKSYPKGTTFKEKVTKHTAEQMLKQEPGFYKIKPHKTDEDSVVVKIAGTGDAQKKQLMEMVLKWKVPFDGGSDGLPIVGGQNVMVFAKKKDLAKTAKTETTHTPTVPEQPPEFQAKALPHFQKQSGQLITSNPEDLAALPNMDTPGWGHAILMGKPGIFRDGHVRTRKVKAADGKLYYEVTGHLHKFDNTKSALTAGQVLMPSANTKKVKAPKTGVGMIHATDASGVVNESSDAIMAESGYIGMTVNGSTTQVFTGSPTFKGQFRIRIPADQDVTAETAAAFTAMGVDPKKAMAKLTPTDERTMKKWHVVRAYLGAKGWNKALKGPQNIFKEKWLDAELVKLGVPEAYWKDAEIRQTFEGHVSVVLPDADRWEHFKFLRRSETGGGIDSLFYQIVGGVGWASRKHRYLNGANSSGMSPGSDIENGGATGAFFYTSTSAIIPGGSHVIVHPRVMQRSDWWRYSGHAGDSSPNYGKIAGQGQGNLGHSLPRSKTHNAGETMFEGGVGLHDVMAVTVNDKASKDKLVTACKAEGVDTVNGVPLEDFVIIGGGDILQKIHPDLR